MNISAPAQGRESHKQEKTRVCIGIVEREHTVCDKVGEAVDSVEDDTAYSQPSRQLPDSINQTVPIPLIQK